LVIIDYSIYLASSSYDLAHLEMRFAGLNELYTFVVLTILAGLGLGMGEIIDIVFFPSIRY
jgi:hypothetical protein